MVKFKVEDANFNKIYPVGAIYMSVNSTNPSELFGGEWEQIEDRFLLACGTNHNNGETGGEATHTLTTDEMPSHTHIQNSHNHTQNSHYHTPPNSSFKFLTTDADIILNSTKRAYTDQSSSGVHYAFASAAKNGIGETNTGGTIATNKSTTATNQDTGGSQAHNNMPPYLAVYCWVRIA